VKATLINGVELNQSVEVRFIGADISKCKDSVELVNGFVKGKNPIIENGINYGRPLFLGKQIWLD
jgi:hypothetical protein